MEVPKIQFASLNLSETGEELVVRGCSLDSGSTTADTEIVRISNCGAFKFEDRYIFENI